MKNDRTIGKLLGTALGLWVLWGGVVCTSVLAESLEAELTQITQVRDALKEDVKNADVKLNGAQKKLQDLIRSQAPLTDVQVQKERIRAIQKEQLKLLTSLVEVEEKRAVTLMKLKAEKSAPPVEKPDASTKTAEKPPIEPATGETPSDAAPKVATQDVAMQLRGLNEFKEALSQLKRQRDALESAIAGYTVQIQSTRAQLDKLGDNADNKEKTKLNETLNQVVDRKQVSEKKLITVQNELVKVQRQFEAFVNNQGRDSYIMPGQKLELTVVEDKAFNGKYIVKPGGYILLPRIGRIGIAGKSREDAENTVKKALEDTQLRIATVLLEPASLDDPDEERREMELELLKAKTKYYSGEKSDIGQDVIYLTGAFKRQGPWVIPKGFQPTLLTTLIRSGWVREDADLSKVRVLRMVDGRSITETIDVESMMSGEPGIMDVKLGPSDVIIVPEAKKKQKDTVYLTGNVRNPGPLVLSFERRVTAYTAILNAGGFSRFADLAEVFILRDTGKPKKERIPVNMKKVKSGEIADPEIMPNDIIVVPESFWGTGN